MHDRFPLRRLLFTTFLLAGLIGLASCDSSASKSESAKGEMIAELMQDLESQRLQYEEVVRTMEAASLSRDTGAMRREEVLGMLSTWLHELPEDAVVKLTRSDAGSHYVSDLVIENLETVRIREREIAAQSVLLSTVRKSNTQLDIILRIYDGPVSEDARPIEEMTLLRDVFRFEWWAMDGETAEWTETWDDRTRLPAWFELNALFSAQDQELLHYFSCPHELSARTRG